MRIGILGRSETLLSAAKMLHDEGHEITWIVTAPSESYYLAKESDFENLAEVIGCPFFMDSRIEESKILSALEVSNTDLVISVNWPRIIGSVFCKMFPMGIFNAHLGDLPKYRGNACPNWAIINGESRVGLCIHQMIPNSLDSGPIYARGYYSLNQNTYISEVYEWAREKIPLLFIELINNLGKESFKPEEQSSDPANWLRCYPRRPSDSQIRWERDADSIQRLVRASSKPFSGAYSYLEGNNRVIIWKSEVFLHEGDFFAIPGQLLSVKNGSPIIACGKDALKIEDYEITENLNGLKLNRMRSRLIFVNDQANRNHRINDTE
jgi:methionyl-tRNA formyltransferase